MSSTMKSTSTATGSTTSGHRRETRAPLSARVRFTVGSLTLAGWALNQTSRGLRALVEDSVLPVDTVVDVQLELPDTTRRSMRVVWSQRAAGGCVVGLAMV